MDWCWGELPILSTGEQVMSKCDVLLLGCELECARFHCSPAAR